MSASESGSESRTVILRQGVHGYLGGRPRTLHCQHHWSRRLSEREGKPGRLYNLDIHKP